ncbi:MAG: rRNA maturation RNase YbeY [Lachnospiraceae bacterium]|nr:rRNA maturation RNase YbeY [Lachnospiraceae bacterium]
MVLFAENESGITPEIPWEQLAETVAEGVLQEENCPFEAEVNVLLVSKEEIQRMNREFRGIDRVTDVLSFPSNEYPVPGDFSDVPDGDPDYFDPENGALLLGDIVICYERAMEQAEEYGHSLKREFSFLIAHSMLHLLGFDHMESDDAALMERKQEQILESLDIRR